MIKISESEWQVMTIIWEREPVSAGDVVEKLSAKSGWHSRTIRTLLDRLVKKGALGVDSTSKPALYRARLNMADCVQQESQSFLQRVFAGESASMLMHFVKESKLSGDEIKQLKKLLSEKEK
jgi:BlaI family transcriptional regulator, penicillinase repressor